MIPLETLEGDESCHSWVMARFYPHYPPRYPSLSEMPLSVYGDWQYLDLAFSMTGQPVGN